MKRYHLTLAGLLALAAISCAPQVDVKAEKAAIEIMLADWVEVTNQGGEAGADGYAAFVTEDAVFLPPNEVRIDGRAGVREMILPFTLAEDFSIDWKATSIEVSADGKLAYTNGVFEYSLKDAAGNPVSDKGKFVDVFKKQADGSWKCSLGMWSSDLPEGGAVDVEADVAAVRSVFDEVTAALNPGGGDVVDLDTEDAVVMYAGEPAAIGKEAIRTRQQRFRDQATFEETRSVEEVVVSGDWAFVRWAGTGTVTPKDGGESSEFNRKGITIFQRQPDNSWKVARAIWNSNLPRGE